jgi:hypothetical protein
MVGIHELDPEMPAGTDGDADPPHEPQYFGELSEMDGVREPADDDPPREPRSPWNETRVDVDQPKQAPTGSSDEDPPAEPREVTSIPHAHLDLR